MTNKYIQLCEKERDNAPNTAMRLYWEQAIQEYLRVEEEDEE